jgi:hypothetical protein
MVNNVACPKCKAKIGIIKEKLATQTGTAFGVLCYMCGCWIQGYPGLEERINKPLEVPVVAT